MVHCINKDASIRAGYFLYVLTLSESRVKVWHILAPGAVRSKTMVLWLLIHYSLLLLVWGFCVWSLFCYAILCVHSRFAVILMGKRELVAHFIVFLVSCG